MCFFCSNPINPQRQSHVFATIEHRYKGGGVRQSDRGFHLSCFDKFTSLGGRPFNPHTTYEALQAVVKRDGEILYELGTGTTRELTQNSVDGGPDATN